MANSAKNKGDRNELAAVRYLIETAPELVSVKKPERKLGAGRREDVGDLHVYADTAIQVRALADMGKAVRSSAADALIQAGHGDMAFALGMVPVPRARKEQVTWLACVAVDHWPVPVEPVAEFGSIGKALAWVREDTGPHGFRPWPREERIGLLSGQGTPALIAPMAAWLSAYATALSQRPQMRAVPSDAAA